MQLRNLLATSTTGALACALALLLLSPATVATAQTPRGGGGELRDGEDIEEIVVYTRKREEAILDVPVSVTAFTEETINNVAPSTLRDLDGLSPNVFIGMNTAGPSASAIYIRGQGYGDIEKTQAPPVGVVVDNVFLGSSTAQLVDTFDVEQIEINRGPQTILYGKNTTGGTIVIRRRKPEFESTNGRVRVSYGDYEGGEGDGGAWNAQGVANLGGETLALRVGYTLKDSDGYVRNLVTDESVGAVDYQGIVAKLRWKPTENFEALLGYDWIRDRGDIPPQDPLFDGAQPWTNRADRGTTPGGVGLGAQPEGQFYDADIVSLDMTWDTDIGIFQSVTTSVTSADFVRQDFDGTTCGDGTYGGCYLGTAAASDTSGALPGGGFADGSYPFAQLHTNRDQEYDTFSQELRWSNSTLDNRLHLTAGAFWWEHEIALEQHTEQITHLPPALVVASNDPASLAPNRIAQTLMTTCGDLNLPFPTPAGGMHPNTQLIAPFLPDAPGELCRVPAVPSTQLAGEEGESWSLFASASLDITPEWNTTFGVRHIDEEKDFYTEIFPTGGMAVDGDPTTGFTRVNPNGEWSDTVFEISTDYHINNNMMVYASFSQGFRSGGFSIRGVQPEHLPYDPENVDQLEFGFKGSLLEDTLQVSLAYFLTDTEGRQFNSVVVRPPGLIPGTETFILNHTETETSGFEAELSWAPVEALRIYGTFGYQDGEVENSIQLEEFLSAPGTSMAGSLLRDGQCYAAGTTDFTDPANEVANMLCYRDFAGNKLTRQPEFSYAIGATFTQDIGAGTLSADLRFKHQDDFIIAIGSPNVIEEAYSLFDATIAYAWEANETEWRAALVGKNLGNETYRQQTLPAGGFQGWGPPRYFGLELGINF